MDNSIVLAQATSSAPRGAPVQTIKLYKPKAGETIVFHASYNGTVKVIFTDIANEKITLYKDNAKQSLHIIFADGSQAIIEPFFDSTGPLANFIIEVAPGQDLTGQQFALQFPTTTDQAVLPAAGEGNGTPTGADFHDPSVDPLATLNPLPLLTPEELPPIVFTQTTGSGLQDEPVPGTTPLTPFTLGGNIRGTVEEEQLNQIIIKRPSLAGNGNEDTNDNTVNDSKDDLDTPTDPNITTNIVHGIGENSLAALVTSSQGAPTFKFADITNAPVMAGGQPLTSIGEPVTFQFISETEIRGVTAGGGESEDGGRIIFFLTLDPASGEWTFTLNDQIDHPTHSQDDGTSNGALEETLQLDLSPAVIITDGNGEHTLPDGSFTVGVIDDTPIIPSTNPTVLIDDEASATTYASPNADGADDQNPDTVAVNGTLQHAFGADIPGTVVLRDDGAPDGFTYTLSNSDHTLTISQVQNGTSVDVLKIIIDDAGNYTVQQLSPVFHDTPGSSEENQLFTINYRVGDYDQDTVDGSLTISVNDDTPVLLDNNGVAGEVDEDGLTIAADLSDGNLDNNRDGETPGTNNKLFTSDAASNLNNVVSFGADGPNTDAFRIVDETTAQTWLASLGLKSNQHDVNVVSINGDTLTASSDDGREIFKLTVNDDGSWSFELNDQIDHPLIDNPNTDAEETAFEDTVTVNVGGFIEAVDGDGDPVSLENTNIAVTIRDDVPIFLEDPTDASGSIHVASTTGLDGAFDISIGADEPGHFTVHAVGQDQYFIETTTNPDGTITLQAFFDAAHTQPFYTLTVDPTAETYNFHLDGSFPSTTTFEQSDPFPFTPGKPEENLTSTISVGGTAVGTVTFDGVFFPAGGGMSPISDPEDNSDKLNPGNEGFGVGGNNVNDNSGFIATFGGTDAKSMGFIVNFGGEGVDFVDITWVAYKDGVQVATGTDHVLNPDPGQETPYLIDPAGEVVFDEVHVRFDFDGAGGSESAKLINFSAEVSQTTTPTEINLGFEVCATDADNDEVCGDFTVTVTDTVPTVSVPSSEDAGTHAYEAGLPLHDGLPAGTGESADGVSTDNDDQSETTSGTINFTAVDGVTSVTIDGTEITLAELQDSSTTNILIAGGFGTLTINGFSFDAGTGAGTIEYSYTLEHNSSGNGTFDPFAVQVTDTDNDVATGTLKIFIVNDKPQAVADVTSTAENTQVSYNVITNSDGTSDVPSADGGTTLIAASLAQGTGNVSFNADGTINFTPTNGFDGTAIINYTIKDADNDQSSTTLTINVSPAVSTPNVSVDTDAVVIKEDNSKSVTFSASVVSGSGDVLTQGVVSGLTNGVGYKINGGALFVSDGTDQTVTFAANTTSTNVTVEVFPPEDGDADIGAVTLTVTAADAGHLGLTTTNAATSGSFVVDAVLDRYADVTQSSAPSGSELTGSQTVGLNLTLGFVDTTTGVPNATWNSPSNEPRDTTVADTDNSETVTVTIVVGAAANTAGVDLMLVGAPAGSSLSETAPGSGTWTLTVLSQADLTAAVAAVSAVVPANFDGSVTGTITAVSTDTAPNGLEPQTADNSFTDNADWSLTIAPQVGTPSVTNNLEGEALLVKEDNSNTVTFTASVAAGSDDVLTQAVISGLVSGATYTIPGVNGGLPFVSDGSDVTVTFAANTTSTNVAITVAPAEDSDADLGTITVTVTAADGNNLGVTTTNSATADVTVDAVLDRYADVAQSSPTTVNESGSAQNVGLNLTLGFVDTTTGVPNATWNSPSNEPRDNSIADIDGSETVSVTITVGSAANAAGVDLTLVSAPAGASLSEAVAGSGVWTLTVTDQSDLSAAVAAIKAVVPAGFDGAVTGSISATSTDTAPGGSEPDLTDNSYRDSANWSFTVNPISPPTIAISGDNCTPEDTTLSVSFAATPDSITHITQIVVTGLSGWSADLGSIVLSSGAIDGTATFAGGTLTIPITGTIAGAVVTATIDLTPPLNSDSDASIHMTATAADGATVISNTPTDATLFVDAVADAITNVDITVADSSDSNSAFSTGEVGEVHATATFGDAVDGSETHTLTIKLQSGFIATELGTSGTSWTHDSVTYNYAYTYNQASGEIVVTVPDGQALADLEFGVKAPTSGVLPATLTFDLTATAQEVPTDTGGCLLPGNTENTADNIVTVTDTTGIAAEHSLNSTISGNTNHDPQDIVLTFVDTADFRDAYSGIVLLNEEGQQGTKVSDAGFNINPAHTFEVAIDDVIFSPGKVQFTNFAIEGVTINQPSGGNIAFDFDKQGGIDAAMTAVLTPSAGGSVTGTYSADQSTGNTTFTDPAGTPFHAIYGNDGTDTINGNDNADLLIGGRGADTLNGDAGNDILVYNKLDTAINGGAGFDILRIDDGALFNTTSQGGPSTTGLTGANAAENVTNAIVDLRAPGAPVNKISNIEAILITEEAVPDASLGTTVQLTAQDVFEMTSAQHELYIIGSKGDNVGLGDFGSWTDTGVDVVSTGGQTFSKYTATVSATTVTMFIDNDLHVQSA